MSIRRVTARVATTHPVAKYGGVRVERQALEEMQAALERGEVPMVNNHSALQPLSAEQRRAQVVELPDGEYALEIEFEIEEREWAQIADQWKAAGVTGGFSFAAGATQCRFPGTGEAIRLAADAAAFSDAARERAGRVLAQSRPVEVQRLYQFSTPDLARIVLEVAYNLLTGVSAGIFTVVLIDALGGLVHESDAPSTIELRIQQGDGTIKTAVVHTDDPEVIRAAIESLDQARGGAQVQRFDSTQGLWLPG